MAFTLKHLGEPITFEDAARAARLSGRTLSRRFEEEAQTTWRRFLHDARMLRAMELLAEEGARVTQTAYAVGFEDPKYFSRVFSEAYGVSPAAFRASARG